MLVFNGKEWEKRIIFTLLYAPKMRADVRPGIGILSAPGPS